MTTPSSVAQQFFASVGARDLPAILASFSEQFDWYVPGAPLLPWAGRRSSKAEVAAFFETLWPLTVEGQSEINDVAMLADGANVALFATFRHVVSKTGLPFTIDVAFKLEIDGGKITRLHMVEDTMAAIHAFQLN